MVNTEKESERAIPLPPESVRMKTKQWAKGTPIERLHSVKFSAVQFNPGLGNARFSPLKNEDSVNVPTIYGGESLSVAIMETLLHDLPTPCVGIAIDMAKLGYLAHSQIVPLESLTLLDINPRTMKKLGITQAQLLGSSADNYAITQKWASRLYQDNPEAQGLQWPSKQHGGYAIMLFGDRIRKGMLHAVIDTEPAIQSLDVKKALESLVDEMELVLISNS